MLSPCEPLLSDDSTSELLNELNLDIAAIAVPSTVSKEIVPNSTDRNVEERPKTPVVSMNTVLTGNTKKTQDIPTNGSTNTEDNFVKIVKDCDLNVVNTDDTVPADNPVKDEPISENETHNKIPKLEPKLELDQVATLKT